MTVYMKSQLLVITFLNVFCDRMGSAHKPILLCRLIACVYLTGLRGAQLAGKLDLCGLHEAASRRD